MYQYEPPLKEEVDPEQAEIAARLLAVESEASSQVCGDTNSRMSVANRMDRQVRRSSECRSPFLFGSTAYKKSKMHMVLNSEKPHGGVSSLAGGGCEGRECAHIFF